ncbi:MAG: hypothetical protein WBE38_02870, partial [Terracidiphilus sp.]
IEDGLAQPRKAVFVKERFNRQFHRGRGTNFGNRGTKRRVVRLIVVSFSRFEQLTSGLAPLWVRVCGSRRDGLGEE